MARGRATGPTILVHELAHAQAALEAAARTGSAVTLRSAPGAVAYAGLGYFKALFDDAAAAHAATRHGVVLDCGDDGARAHRALVIGFRQVAYGGPARIGAKLADIAARLGAKIVRGGPPPGALDLRDSGDPLGAATAYLERRARNARS